MKLKSEKEAPERKLKTIITTKKILKGNHSCAPIVQIPKEKFENALKLIKAPQEKEVWMESCLKFVHSTQDKKHDVTKNINGRFLSEARICLLKRDWIKLAKILTVIKPVTTINQYEFWPSFLKYAAIFLYYNYNAETVEEFLKGVCLKNNCDIDFFKELTSFPS